MVNEEHLDVLVDKFIDKLKNSRHTVWIDPETHAEQHVFISQMIEDRKDRAERRRRIEEKIAGSVILTAITGLVYLIGSGVMEWIREHVR